MIKLPVTEEKTPVTRTSETKNQTEQEEVKDKKREARLPFHKWPSTNFRMITLQPNQQKIKDLSSFDL